MVVRGPWRESGGGSCVDVGAGAGAVSEVGFGLGFGNVLAGGVRDSVPCISLCGVAVVVMTFAPTYAVDWLVSPPPAGIATVVGNGGVDVCLMPLGHMAVMIDGPPGRQEASPGYWAL